MRVLPIIFLLAVSLLSFDLNAQCAMCKASVEAGGTNVETLGAGLNKGILFLMSIPYLLFSIVGIAWYRTSKKKKKEEAELRAKLKPSSKF